MDTNYVRRHRVWEIWAINCDKVLRQLIYFSTGEDTFLVDLGGVQLRLALPIHMITLTIFDEEPKL